MKLTAQLKLLPTPEQTRVLRKTLEMANAACNAISQQTWESQTFRQFRLHRLTYQAAREQYPLSAQVMVRCIAKVADAYKIDQKTQRTFKASGAIALDSRILSFDLEQETVSIWTIGGRQQIAFAAGERQLELLKGQRGESDLCLVGGSFYLLAACEVETPARVEVEGYLGVDLGVKNIASDSDGNQYSGGQVNRLRKRHFKLRSLLRNDKFYAGFVGCPSAFSACFMRASPFSPEDRGELHFSLYNEGGGSVTCASVWSGSWWSGENSA